MFVSAPFPRSLSFSHSPLPHMRYFLHLAYDYTQYHGWQVQPNALTVQAELDRYLS